jgi:hypothetical protein
MAYSGQGSGTEQDPYLITTVKQLKEIFDMCRDIICDSTASASSIHTKLVNDLDFNTDSDYWCIPSHLFSLDQSSASPTINNCYLYIDGNNHGLYNMYCYNVGYVIEGASKGSIQFSNCIFEVIAISSEYSNLRQLIRPYAGSSGLRGDKNIEFINCDFRIKQYNHYNSGSAYNFFGQVTLTNCIINMDIIANKEAFYSSVYSCVMDGGSSYIYPSQYYNEWKINILLTNSTDLSGGNYKIGLFSSTKHYFSSFFINVNCVKANGGDIYFSSSNSSTAFYNSYMVVKNISNNEYSFNKFYFNSYKNGINFYDADVIDSTKCDMTGYGNGELLPLTTAQCKNATFLEQQGFIIAT